VLEQLRVLRQKSGRGAIIACLWRFVITTGMCRSRLFCTRSSLHRTITVPLQLPTQRQGTQDAPFRSRQEEDDLCGKIIVSIVAHACGILDDAALPQFLLRNGLHAFDSFSIGECRRKCALQVRAEIHRFFSSVSDYLSQSLLSSSCSNVLCIPRPDLPSLLVSDIPINLLGRRTANPPRIIALPGSFNPLHAGHAASLLSCADLCDQSRKVFPLYELSVFNVDKPPVPLIELEARLAHFSRQNVCILLTKTPRFVDKARAYPGLSYVIGIDTLLRLVDPM
jgi:hypothetical protein